MPVRKIDEGIYAVGAIDWDRRLFDSLIALPNGTSYNSYLVQGSDATVLLEAVDPAMNHVLQEHLTELNVERLDYLVANHAEQDHSGSIPMVLERYPMAKVVCTPKCSELLQSMLHLRPDAIMTAEDGEKLSLGDRTLEFMHMPWVHWPETMVSYLREDKLLFSCDFFGSHLAISDLYAHDKGLVAAAAKRYYAEIMMPFARNISRHLDRLAGYDIATIAPSHGPIYDEPAFIMDLYREWATAEPKNEVLVAYVTMHDSTRLMTEHVVSRLIEKGVTTHQFNLVGADMGELAMTLIDAATVLIGTPTVLAGPHPNAAYAAVLINALRPKTKFMGVYGSYGWGTRADQQIAGLCSNLRLDMLDPVIIKGLPREEDYALLDQLVDTVVSKHKEAGIA